jgi:uncharacterized protein YecT (DUF1311 family)
MSEEMIEREIAVQRLRAKLIELTAGTKSACKLATDMNIFCRGFHHYSDDKLREAYKRLVARQPDIKREELEKAANEWQLARQRADGWVLSCDVQYAFYETCKGWDDFTNEQLVQFCRELLGQAVEVVGVQGRPLL